MQKVNEDGELLDRAGRTFKAGDWILYLTKSMNFAEIQYARVTGVTKSHIEIQASDWLHKRLLKPSKITNTRRALVITIVQVPESEYELLEGLAWQCSL